MTPRPRLVLVHGTRFSTTQWAGYDARIPAAELVPIDLPGHGAKVGQPFTTEAAFEAISEGIHRDRDSDDDRPVILAGHSLGGYLATGYAAAHPDEMDALVILGATADPAGPFTALYRGFAKAVPVIGHERLAKFTNGVMRGLGARGETADNLPDGSAYAALPAAWAAVMDHAGPHLLHDVTCPVVLANGQFDQMRLHVTRYARAVEQAPVEIVTIPRATHLMPTTHPAQVAEVLAHGVELGVKHHG
ncbi:alpha/beta fold hydrolase [Parenemella sanctibonifatiensis]|uniref:Peptidase S33 n=1 Tax=Parenemella sanctibonifatiensis TaxID=2016505 RepID=A0A255ELZ2_9ACTN|nr:alpha/beta hydrolase [Parenemella sanctibonifatiensis]OYN90472.1 peptidase S33 [Parenemella sanctibonifatiensis]